MPAASSPSAAISGTLGTGSSTPPPAPGRTSSTRAALAGYNRPGARGRGPPAPDAETTGSGHHDIGMIDGPDLVHGGVYQIEGRFEQPAAVSAKVVVERVTTGRKFPKLLNRELAPTRSCQLLLRSIPQPLPERLALPAGLGLVRQFGGVLRDEVDAGYNTRTSQAEYKNQLSRAQDSYRDERSPSAAPATGWPQGPGKTEPNPRTQRRDRVDPGYGYLAHQMPPDRHIRCAVPRLENTVHRALDRVPGMAERLRTTRIVRD